ncbi:MAG TPA: prohibitin family protein [Nitrospirota bacterium]|nr:prohibitin family protein [Nitrospirota bacterium]
MDQQKVPKMVVVGILAFLGFMLLMSSYFVIDAGERGVILRFGAVNRVVPEGLHFKVPFMEDIVRMTVRVQKTTTKTEAASQDLQVVQTTMVLNYSLQSDKVGETYRTLGLNRDVSEKIINPGIEESFKAAAARYTAEELISKREALKTQVRNYLRDRLAPFGIVVVELSITDFQFSTEFNKAIESKQSAEQHALRAKRDLDRIKVEAQQKIATAQADAEALRLQRQVISPDLIKLRQIDAQIKAIEKWDGKLPSVTGGAVPFIQVEDLKK